MSTKRSRMQVGGVYVGDDSATKRFIAPTLHDLTIQRLDDLTI
jgi:hypothetical protein